MHRIGVRFVLRLSQSNRHAQNKIGTIYAVITANGDESKPFSTGQKACLPPAKKELDLPLWKGTVYLSDSKELNSYLNSIRADIELNAQLCKREGRAICPHILQSEYLAAVRNKKPPVTLVSILEWYATHKEVSGGTATTYATRHKNLILFLNAKNEPQMLAENFDSKIAAQYFDFLKTLKYGDAHTIRQIRQVKAALKEAAKRGKIEANPLEQWAMAAPKTQDLRHLEARDLQRLRIWQTTNARFDQARDQFLMMVYLGVHIGDYLKISRLDFETDENKALWYLGNRAKTGKGVIQKVHPIAKQIISKYGGLIENLPKINKDDFNILLKAIDEIFEFGVGLSSKIGRKTFAHLCLNVHLFDQETTAAMMGCEVENIKAYAKVTKQRVDAVVKW